MGKSQGTVETTDGDLLHRALDESQPTAARQAASELLGRYQDRVYAWCYRRVREPEMARDLAQEVLVSAYRNLGSFGGRAQFGSWLFAIARNRCLSELRRPALLYEDEAEADAVPSSEPDPEQAFQDRLDEEAALSLIRDNLDSFEQDVIWLRCFEKVPVITITEIMKIKDASGARGVLQRARRKLRAAVARRRYGDTEVAGHD